MSKMEGLERLRAKLRALPDVAKEEIRAALKESAEDIVGMQERMVPFKSGDLFNSIGYTFGAYRAENSNVRGVSMSNNAEDPDLSVTIHAGDAKAYYAAFVEFGTVKMRARPYFFPAYRAQKRRIKSRLTRATTRAARKVAAGGQ